MLVRSHLCGDFIAFMLHFMVCDFYNWHKYPCCCLLGKLPPTQVVAAWHGPSGLSILGAGAAPGQRCLDAICFSEIFHYGQRIDATFMQTAFATQASRSSSDGTGNLPHVCHQDWHNLNVQDARRDADVLPTQPALAKPQHLKAGRCNRKPFIHLLETFSL